MKLQMSQTRKWMALTGEYPGLCFLLLGRRLSLPFIPGI